ncbi:hypothetical protein GQ457_15G022550 [Hibiscus cannabinus]
MTIPDKSSAMVHTQYLPFYWYHGKSMDIVGVQQFWHFYTERCARLRRYQALNANIGGCMVLLQSWAWNRLPFLAPICVAPSEFPLATR